MNVYTCIYKSRVLFGKNVQCYKAELFYNGLKSKRRHKFAVTVDFTPRGDRQTDFYLNKSLSDERHEA